MAARKKGRNSPAKNGGGKKGGVQKNQKAGGGSGWGKYGRTTSGARVVGANRERGLPHREGSYQKDQPDNRTYQDGVRVQSWGRKDGSVSKTVHVRGEGGKNGRRKQNIEVQTAWESELKSRTKIDVGFEQRGGDVWGEGQRDASSPKHWGKRETARGWNDANCLTRTVSRKCARGGFFGVKRRPSARGKKKVKQVSGGVCGKRAKGGRRGGTHTGGVRGPTAKGSRQQNKLKREKKCADGGRKNRRWGGTHHDPGRENNHMRRGELHRDTGEILTYKQQVEKRIRLKPWRKKTVRASTPRRKKNKHLKTGMAKRENGRWGEETHTRMSSSSELLSRCRCARPEMTDKGKTGEETMCIARSKEIGTTHLTRQNGVLPGGTPLGKKKPRGGRGGWAQPSMGGQTKAPLGVRGPKTRHKVREPKTPPDTGKKNPWFGLGAIRGAPIWAVHR